MPVTIYGGIRRSLFDGVDRVYLGGETITLRDAEGGTLIGASVSEVAPLVIQNPAIQPADAVLGDTITLTIDRNDHERTVDVTLDEMPQDKKR